MRWLRITLLVWSLFHTTVVYTTNLLVNPSFEESLRGTWISGGCQLEQYSGDVLHGNYSAKCGSRTSDNHGPAQELTGLVPGGGYAFLGYVKLLADNPQKLWQRFKVTMKFSFTDSAAVQYSESSGSGDDGEDSNTYVIAYRGFVTSDKGWITLAGDLNAPMIEFDTVRLQIRGPDAGLDFLVDNVTLWEVPKHPDWEGQARINIERYRKSNMTFQVDLPQFAIASEFDIEIKHKKHQFAFGSLFRDDILRKETNQTKIDAYVNLFTYLFNWATIQSYKWKFDRGTPEQPDFSSATTATALLRSKGLKVRGHSMLWGFEKNIPEWVLQVSASNLRGVVHDHIRYMVNISKGTLEHWDVQNEYMYGHYYEEKLRDRNFTIDIFKLAKPLDPYPKLFLNDFQAVTTGANTEEYHDLAMHFKAAGTGIEGIGVQGHTKSYVKPDPTMMWRRLDRLADTGLDIFMTEFDIAWEDDLERADWLEDAFRAFFAHPDLGGVILWDFWDVRMSEPFKHLVSGEELDIIEPGQRWACLTKKEWTTHVTKNLGQSGLIFDLRGFLGEYEVIVRRSGVPIQNMTFSVGSSRRTVRITVRNTTEQIELPKERDYVPECISHRAERSLGNATSSSADDFLSCRTVKSALSGTGENDEATAVCDTDEVLTSCFSFHNAADWRRNGEKIAVEDGVAKCKAFNGRESPDGVKAVAQCCKMAGLTCVYRTAGPSAIFDGAKAEARCPAGTAPYGCSTYSRYPDSDGVYVDTARNSCVAQSGAPISDSPAERSGVTVTAACCTAPDVQCSIVESGESSLGSGNSRGVECPGGHMMTGCMAFADSGKAAGARITETGQTSTCVGTLGADPAKGSRGVKTYAVCCALPGTPTVDPGRPTTPDRSKTTPTFTSSATRLRPFWTQLLSVLEFGAALQIAILRGS